MDKRQFLTTAAVAKKASHKFGGAKKLAMIPSTAASTNPGHTSSSGGSGGSASSIIGPPSSAVLGEEHLMVAVRVRPCTNTHEEKCIQILSKKSLLFDDGTKARPRKYLYDYVFGEDSTQDEVYKTTTAPLVRDVLNGLNAAVFAYGATGAGKTHTMLGPNPKKAATPSTATPGELPPKTSSAVSQGDGLMVKAIDDIFQHVEKAEKPESFKVFS